MPRSGSLAKVVSHLSTVGRRLPLQAELSASAFACGCHSASLLAHICVCLIARKLFCLLVSVCSMPVCWSYLPKPAFLSLTAYSPYFLPVCFIQLVRISAFWQRFSLLTKSYTGYWNPDYTIESSTDMGLRLFLSSAVLNCRDHLLHELINYIDTKTNCRHLTIFSCTLRQVLIRVYRQEIQSVMLVFSTQLCELLPL